MFLQSHRTECFFMLQLYGCSGWIFYFHNGALTAGLGSGAKSTRWGWGKQHGSAYKTFFGHHEDAWDTAGNVCRSPEITLDFFHHKQSPGVLTDIHWCVTRCSSRSFASLVVLKLRDHHPLYLLKSQSAYKHITWTCCVTQFHLHL